MLNILAGICIVVKVVNYVWPNPIELVNIKTWQGHINYVEDWVLKKLSYLIKYFYV